MKRFMVIKEEISGRAFEVTVKRVEAETTVEAVKLADPDEFTVMSLNKPAGAEGDWSWWEEPTNDPAVSKISIYEDEFFIIDLTEANQ